MSRIKLDYVQEYESAGRIYRYFRRGGVRIRLPGRPGSTEFMAAYSAALARSEPEPVTRTAARSVAHAADILVETMSWKQLAPSTRKVMALTLGHVVKAHGHRSMTTLTRPDLIRLRDSMADRPGAARNWIEVFRKLCRVAMDQGWRADDPSTGVKVEYKADAHEPWTWTDVQRFIDHHKCGRPVLALMLLLATGQRRGDVVRMAWRDVQGDMIRVVQGKTAKPLVLPIRPELMALIYPLPRDAPAFLITSNGKPFSAASFGMWFRSQCDAAGLEHLSAHGLRKLAMVGAADHGATAHELMAISGHASLAMVSHYTRAADQERLARRAVDYPLPIRLGDAGAAPTV